MSNKYRNRLEIKFEAFFRLTDLLLFKESRNITLLTEYPKSGGTWLGLMLSDLMYVSFPRHEIPWHSNYISHGHYLNKDYKGKNICLWRDPRDLLVSWYYHCFFSSEKNNLALVNTNRAKCNFYDFDDISSNMPDFIDMVFSNKIGPGFSLKDFYCSWNSNDNVCHVKYEDLRLDPLKTLTNILVYCECKYDDKRLNEVIEKFSFKNMSGRDAGKQDNSSFLRKGVVGDWENIFDNKSCEKFNHHFGKELIEMGYETNDSWIYEKNRN